jgi:hypothetical protein
MKEEIKIVARITVKSSLKWFTIVSIGTLFTLICFLIIIFQDNGGSGGGHGSVYAYLVNLFSYNFCGFLLFIGTPIFVLGYFMIANKVAIQTVIHQIWENKMGSFIEEKVVFLVDKLTASNNWTNSISNKTMLKLKLLEANKNDKESSKIKKKTISYVLNKISFDNVDFANKDLKLSEVVSGNINKFVSETIEPSFLFFWLLLLFQLVLIIIAIFFR